jgi:ABC-type antimicrobial peptide transport system permease subunit
MFLVLGGLGVLLGTAGLAIVVVRNVQERRAELAMLRCAGIPRRAVVGMVLAEHRLLLGLGLLTGLGAALVAVAPSLRAHDSGVPWGLLAAIVAALGLGGLAWTALAARAALRGQPADALREE